MLKRYNIPSVPTVEECRKAARLAARGKFYSPFVIVGVASRFFFDSGICAFQIVLSPAQPNDVGFLEDNEAKKIIEANNMKRAYSGRSGRVYEAPGEPFLSEWAGYFGTEVLSRVWSGIERDQGFPVEAEKEETYACLDGHGLVIFGPAQLISFLKSRDGGDAYPASLALKSLRSRVDFIEYHTL